MALLNETPVEYRSLKQSLMGALNPERTLRNKRRLVEDLAHRPALQDVPKSMLWNYVFLYRRHEEALTTALALRSVLQRLSERGWVRRPLVPGWWSTNTSPRLADAMVRHGLYSGQALVKAVGHRDTTFQQALRTNPSADTLCTFARQLPGLSLQPEGINVPPAEWAALDVLHKVATWRQITHPKFFTPPIKPEAAQAFLEAVHEQLAAAHGTERWPQTAEQLGPFLEYVASSPLAGLEETRNPKWFSEKILDAQEKGCLAYSLDAVVDALIDEVRKGIPSDRRDFPVASLQSDLLEMRQQIFILLQREGSGRKIPLPILGALEKMVRLTLEQRMRAMDPFPDANRFGTAGHPFAMRLLFGPKRIPLEEVSLYQDRYGRTFDFALPSLSQQRGGTGVPVLGFQAAVRVLVTFLTDKNYQHLLSTLRLATKNNALGLGDIQGLELWPIKVGGVGLVTRIQAKVKGQVRPVLLSAVISRDLLLAKNRIEHEFGILSSWYSTDPRPEDERQVMQPYLVGYLGITRHREDPAAVGTAAIMFGEWLDGYYENHVVQVDGKPRILVVREWGGLNGPEGVLLDEEESEEIWGEYARLRTFYSHFGDGATTGIFAINDGPFVATLDGDRLRRTKEGRPDVKITSVSGAANYSSMFLPIGLAMDSASYRPDPTQPQRGQLVFWNQPRQALEAFVAGLVDRAVAGKKGTSFEQAKLSALKQANDILELTASVAPHYPQEVSGRSTPIFAPLNPEANRVLDAFKQELPLFIRELKDRITSLEKAISKSGLEEKALTKTFIVIGPTAFEKISGLKEAVAALKETPFSPQVIDLSGDLSPERWVELLMPIMESPQPVALTFGRDEDPVLAQVQRMLEAARIPLASYSPNALIPIVQWINDNVGRATASDIEQAIQEFLSAIGLDEAA